MSVSLFRFQAMDEAEFWSNLLGSTEFIYEWWSSVTYLGDADWDKPGEVQLCIQDPEDESNNIAKILTLADLVSAYNAVACDPELPNINIEDMDEDSTDLVLQYAMLGEIVYG